MGILRSLVDLLFEPKHYRGMRPPVSTRPPANPAPPPRSYPADDPLDNVRPLHRRVMTGDGDVPKKTGCVANCVVEKEQPNLTKNEIWNRWINERR